MIALLGKSLVSYELEKTEANLRSNNSNQAFSNGKAIQCSTLSHAFAYLALDQGPSKSASRRSELHQTRKPSDLSMSSWCNTVELLLGPKI